MHTKSNLAPKGLAIDYELREGVFYWTGESSLTVVQILAADNNTGNSELDEAMTFLKDELAQVITGNPDAKASDLTDDILRKLTLEPDIVRDTAKANGQSLAEVAAGELGMSYGEFQKALRLILNAN